MCPVLRHSPHFGHTIGPSPGMRRFGYSRLQRIDSLAVPDSDARLIDLLLA